MKLAYVINVDFALLHFLRPLMRAARARGHDVLAICADGPLLADLRAEGFRIIAVPLVRRASPWAQMRALRELRTVLRRERPDLAASWHGWRPGRWGCPGLPIPATDFCSTSLARRAGAWLPM